LAVGPDGKCALCRRSSAPAFVTIEEKPGWISRTVTVFLILATIAAAVLTFLWVKNPGSSPFDIDYIHRDTANRTLGEAEPFGSKAGSGALSEAGDGGVGEKREIARNASDQAETSKSNEAKEPLSEMKNARQKVSVVMYDTEFCPISAEAKEYMNRTGIRFVERDIDKDPEALARRDKINPIHSTPTFEIDNQVLVGFSAEKLESALNEAASRRLKR
jgi:glutaredoxin